MKMLKMAGLALAVTLTGCGSDSDSNDAPPPATTKKNVLFFLGDGMGITTLTAMRIFEAGEAGSITIDTLPETAFVRTYSADGQVTDSAPSMAAYMTGVKMKNEVISMSTATNAYAPDGSQYVDADGNSTCEQDNGAPVETLLELMKGQGFATGVVTTTRVTHATPISATGMVKTPSPRRWCRAGTASMPPLVMVSTSCSVAAAVTSCPRIRAVAVPTAAT